MGLFIVVSSNVHHSIASNNKKKKADIQLVTLRTWVMELRKHSYFEYFSDAWAMDIGKEPLDGANNEIMTLMARICLFMFRDGCAPEPSALYCVAPLSKASDTLIASALYPLCIMIPDLICMRK